MNSQQAFIQKLLDVEKEAESIVNTARANRQARMKSAREEADKELSSFIAAEEAKLKELEGDCENVDDLEKVTQQETEKNKENYAKVFEQKKEAVATFIIENVITVNPCLGRSQAEKLKHAA